MLIGKLSNNYFQNNEKGMAKPILIKGRDFTYDMNKVLRKLFFDTQGYLKIASSERGQPSAYMNGSLYTKVFDKALTEAIDKNVELT